MTNANILYVACCNAQEQVIYPGVSVVTPWRDHQYTSAQFTQVLAKRFLCVYSNFTSLLVD